MSVDKLVDSTQLNSDLTSIANAIRTKGGTSAQLAFPAGFVSAIAAIPSGGGGIPVNEFIKFMGTTEADIDFTGVTYIRNRALTEARLKNGFFPDVLTTGSQLTQSTIVSSGCMIFPKITSAGNGMFRGGGSGFHTIDLGLDCTTLVTYCFHSVSDLNVLILRRSSLVTLNNASTSFNGTKFASDGTGGTLYVPASLISSYQSASNWSTILGYANNQIKSIESTHTDPTAPIDLTLYYADGTPISA